MYFIVKDCTDFILVIIHRYRSLISVHEVIGICRIFMAFEGHICCWHIYGYNILYKD